MPALRPVLACQPLKPEGNIVLRGITARGGSDRRKRSSDQASVSPVAFLLSCDVLQRSCYNFTSSQTRTEPCTASPAISHSSIYHPLHPTRQPLPCSSMDLTPLSRIRMYTFINVYSAFLLQRPICWSMSMPSLNQHIMICK